MENFIVSARKYRPSTFMSVVGQQSITTTLKNSIRNNQLAHAYLFCGPRGVGKTSCARIFAKTINCFNISDNFEPCNKCESCESFNQSRSYNIHELDAASNNSVEDIRNLIEQVRILPQLGKYSVYIIDEVHMLSASAFNAFLKTLEEPPEHAIFILATTEKHKILPTILSRCQIFDFNRIRVEDAANHLAHIAKNENIAFEEEALTVIAQKADGAMRDALSLFDQISSFSGKNITYKNAIENLNILDYDYYFRLTDAFLENKLSEALLIFNDILNNGFDGHHFVSGLSSHLRDIMVCMDEATVELLEVGASIKDKYKEQAKKCNSFFLFKALSFSNDCDLNYKTSNNQRLLAELMLMKICDILPEEQRRKEAIEQQKNIAAQTAAIQQVAKSSTANTATPPIKNIEAQTKQANTQLDTFSISNAINTVSNPTIVQETQQNEDYSTPQKISAQEAFTSNQLLEVWNKYAAQQSSRFNSMLIAHKPALKDNFKIEFMLNSNTSEEIFNKEIKHTILKQLQRELNNGSIEINTVLNTSNKIKKPLTLSDRYNFLKDKNPMLDQLKTSFKLDFK